MIPSVAFHGARPRETAQETPVPAPEVAPVESPRTAPIAEIKAGDEGHGAKSEMAGGDQTETRRAVVEHAGANAERAPAHSEKERESTRPIADEPAKTVLKMRAALAEALGPPFSAEEATLAAEANRNLMDAQAELRRLRAAQTYRGVDTGTPKTAAFAAGAAPPSETEQRPADATDAATEHVDERV